MQRDQRVENDDIDLVVGDLLANALEQRRVDLQVVVALGDAQRELVAGGQEEMPDEFLLRDFVVLADGEQAPVQLVAAVFSIVIPDAQALRRLLAEQVPGRRHGDSLDHHQGRLAGSSRARRHADRAALIVSAIEPLARRQGRGVDRHEGA